MRAIKMNIEQIKETITIVKDYPIKGIVFKDITTLLENPDAFKSTVDIMVDKVKHLDFNRVVGVESRGFFWSGPIAYALSKSFVLARKPGKLPRKAAEKFFSLEYGTNTVHIHEDAISKGDKVEDFGVGFYTKYGDGGVDISPIADCNKTEVWLCLVRSLFVM